MKTKTFQIFEATDLRRRVIADDFETREAAQAVADEETQISAELGIFNRYVVREVQP